MSLNYAVEVQTHTNKFEMTWKWSNCSHRTLKTE